MFQVGDRVVVAGLTSAAGSALNGKCGTVAGPGSSSARWAVNIEGSAPGTKPLSIKAVNLQPQPPPQPPHTNDTAPVHDAHPGARAVDGAGGAGECVDASAGGGGGGDLMVAVCLRSLRAAGSGDTPPQYTSAARELQALVNKVSGPSSVCMMHGAASLLPAWLAGGGATAGAAADAAYLLPVRFALSSVLRRSSLRPHQPQLRFVQCQGYSYPHPSPKEEAMRWSYRWCVYACAGVRQFGCGIRLAPALNLPRMCCLTHRFSLVSYWLRLPGCTAASSNTPSEPFFPQFLFEVHCSFSSQPVSFTQIS